jgi:hypothetical protein
MSENEENEITLLRAEIERLKKINANLMGDDEDVPRYTTKRLHQEVERLVSQRLMEQYERLKQGD